MELSTASFEPFLQAVSDGAEPGDRLVVPGWDSTHWSTLLESAQPIELTMGDVLIQPRGSDTSLYFVTSGRLQVASIDRAGGGISPLGTISPGSVVGELAFFDGQPRSAKVWAVADSRLLKLTLNDYEHYARTHTAEANVFLFAMARLLAYRVRSSRARM